VQEGTERLQVTTTVYGWQAHLSNLSDVDLFCHPLDRFYREIGVGILLAIHHALHKLGMVDGDLFLYRFVVFVDSGIEMDGIASAFYILVAGHGKHMDHVFPSVYYG
jgi:hypothetical protein